MSTRVKVLNVVGLIFFGAGAVYSLLSHEAHDVLPVFRGSSHALHLFIGIGILAVGTVLLIAGGLVDKRERPEQLGARQ